jgi:hypothetical protein
MESLPFFTGIALFYVLMFMAMGAIYGFAIWAIVDIARRPEWAFRMANADKTLWLVLVAVLLAFCWIADAVVVPIYFFTIRPRVQEAEAAWYAQQPQWPVYPQPPYGSPPTYQ